MRFGYFDDQSREYVITRPDTPLPWINYLGNEAYFGLISNTAGGYSFYRDARLRRITRYRYNNVPLDVGGRYIYVRDDETGDYWSPSWQPTQHAVEEYMCRHGLGYTVIASTYQSITARTEYFVPLHEQLEIWKLTLTNHRARQARLSAFSTVEFALWDAQDDATNFQRNLSTGEVEIEDGVIYHKTGYRERRNHFAFFACSEELAGFDTQRDVFLGPYRGWDRPAAVERGHSFRSVAHGWAPMGSHHVKLTVPPGQSRTIIFLLGYHENPTTAKFDPPGSQQINKGSVRPIIMRYLDSSQVDEAFLALRAHWESLLGVLQVDTPSMHTNRIVNVWNPYQCTVTYNLSRSASYFESGISRGIGFRDANQDLLGSVHLLPVQARRRILDLAATQLRSGGAYHQYQPLTRQGNNAVGSGFNDDPLWLVLSTAAYLKETGDWSILNEKAPYDNDWTLAQPLYEHLQRCLQYVLQRDGPHGLPLIGRADWNDCLNLNACAETPDESFQTAGNKDGKVAESIFIAGLFVLAAREMAEIARRRGHEDDARVYAGAADDMQLAVDSHGWDGGWFLRAYDDRGEEVGSQGCLEGQLFIEPQGICIMAGMGLEDGRAEQALSAVAGILATPHGIMLHQPAFSRYYAHLGEISSYPPGYKENAGVFCHANPWIMIAEAMMGHGDQAHDYYLRINPSVREASSEVHRCEPYVYAQMIAGRDAPTYGEAKNSWLTGTAAWNYVAITQWILGIRPTYDGLRIAPVIPRSWDGYEATRIYRGVTYRISVKRAGKGKKVSLNVDGQPVEGEVVPPPMNGRIEVIVQALLT